MESVEQRTVFMNRFLMVPELAPTQEGAGPRMGIVGEGEKVGEILITVLTEVGVVGADMFLGDESRGFC
jgi:hypothetical protein